MDTESLITTSEFISAVVATILLIVLFQFSRKKENYVVMASMAPLCIQIIYYVLLFFNVEPITSSREIRDFTIRPSMWIFFGLMAVFFVNGSVNDKIRLVHFRSMELFDGVVIRLKSVVEWVKNAFIHK